MSISVRIVASDPLVRLGLARSLGEVADLEVRAGPADVSLFDGGASTGGEPELPADGDDAPELWLVSDPERARVALRRGARGAIARNAAPSRLAVALRAVSEGFTVLEPDFVAAVADTPTARAGGELTSRERSVLELLARGLSNKEIASSLAISEHTAKFHVNSLLSKLGAQSRTEVVVRAARRGWLSL